ncbi:MAG TPA: UvrD-helicase domain-containing protein [Mariprofundaceae bacterium]|nr:UvrD-helicase domain-containing protein [Mariprofundaceae bacterium]
MSNLNPQQYEAVYHRKGPLLVLAGAGSGKTRVITERIAALVERDVPPHAVTAVTFTNKAAREMRQRLAARLGDRAKELRICTFHALGLAMVREHAELLDRRANVSVYAGAEQRSVLRSVLQELRLPADVKQVDTVLGRISALKSGLSGGSDKASAELATIRERYDQLLTAMNAVDFDDLLLLPIRLLAEHESVLALWRERCRYFLVDEYQDSSGTQYDFLRLLVTPEGNLTVVGDDDQSIYGWRGAEIGNLFNLDRDYPGLMVIRLEENYRSTGAILTVSNRLIGHNSQRLGKELRSNLGAGKPVRVWEAEDADDEAGRVAADIVAAHAANQSKWSDFCMLYRAAYQSRPLELALRERGVPYHVSGGMSFFDRAEVRDLLSYMRLIANVDDDMAFMRAISRPRRGIGDKALADLGMLAHMRQQSLLVTCLDDDLPLQRAPVLREFGHLIVGLEHRFLHGEPDDTFDALLAETELEALFTAESDDEKEQERRMANVYEIRRWWLRHAEEGGGLADFMQRICLMSNQDEEENGNCVRLMTVHAAKGLEFSHVYVVGMEDGSFPHKNAVEEERLEEERRLMYVAMTRARHRLTLSHARQRRRYGQVEKQSPSPFLSEIGDEHVYWVDREPDSAAAVEEAAAHMAEMRRMLGLA